MIRLALIVASLLYYATNAPPSSRVDNASGLPTAAELFPTMNALPTARADNASGLSTTAELLPTMTLLATATASTPTMPISPWHSYLMGLASTLADDLASMVMAIGYATDPPSRANRRCSLTLYVPDDSEDISVATAMLFAYYQDADADGFIDIGILDLAVQGPDDCRLLSITFPRLLDPDTIEAATRYAATSRCP